MDRRHQVRVVVHGRHQTSEYRQRNVVDKAAGHTRHGQQVVAKGTGIGVDRPAARLGALHGVHDQVCLAVPPPIQRCLAGPCFGSDGVEGEVVVADVDEQTHRGVEDLFLALALDARTRGPLRRGAEGRLSRHGTSSQHG